MHARAWSAYNIRYNRYFAFVVMRNIAKSVAFHNVILFLGFAHTADSWIRTHSSWAQLKHSLWISIAAPILFLNTSHYLCFNGLLRAIICSEAITNAWASCNQMQFNKIDVFARKSAQRNTIYYGLLSTIIFNCDSKFW